MDPNLGLPEYLKSIDQNSPKSDKVSKKLGKEASKSEEISSKSLGKKNDSQSEITSVQHPKATIQSQKLEEQQSHFEQKFDDLLDNVKNSSTNTEEKTVETKNPHQFKISKKEMKKAQKKERKLHMKGLDKEEKKIEKERQKEGKERLKKIKQNPHLALAIGVRSVPLPYSKQVVNQLINLLTKEDSLKTGKIFRSQGDIRVTNKILGQFDLQNFNIDDVDDTHIAVDLLKRIVGRLDLFDSKEFSSLDNLSEKGKIEKLKEMVGNLDSTEKKEILKNILNYIVKVAENSKENRMNFRTLGKAFGPRMVGRSDETDLPKIIKEEEKVIKTFQFMLKNMNKIF